MSESTNKSVRAKSGAAAFGNNSSRFDYYASNRKQGHLPSPISYNVNDLPTRKGARNLDHKSFSFGVSRS